MIYVYSKKMNGVWYGAAAQDKPILATTFSFKADLRHILRRKPQDIPFQVSEKPNQFLANVLSALEKVLNGKDKESYAFKININHLSSYTQKVFNCTRLVPVGYVTTYGAIANVAGGSPRSVGRVEASNPVPLLIPSHRVVCSNMTAGGSGGGGQLKLEILQREKRGYLDSRRLQVEGRERSLFPVERVKQNRESF